MKIKKQDVYVEDLENGTIWADPDTTNEKAIGFWLKPIEQVYVLTEKELLILLVEFSEKELAYLDDAKEYLKSITK